jgi:hypothetical protein
MNAHGPAESVGFVWESMAALPHSAPVGFVELRIENPLVGGSIPPQATITLSADVHYCSLSAKALGKSTT